MKLNYVIYTILAAVGTSIGGVGINFQESVDFHGEPIGKMTFEDHTTCVFQCGGSTVREVFDKNNQCIESSCGVPEHQRAESISAAPVIAPVSTAPAPPPAPELTPEPTPDALTATLIDALPAPPGKSISWLWLLLILPITGIILVAVFHKRLSNIFKKEPEEDAPEEEKPNGVCFQEATLRLSRNEMSFLKALHEAVHKNYIITFHETPERIMSESGLDFCSDESGLKLAEPVLADFVLHSIDGSDIAAIVLLHNPRSKDQQKIRRINYLRSFFKSTDIQVLLYPENYQYSPEDIKKAFGKLNLHFDSNSTAA